MTAILVDTSIVIKWFHSDGESELGAAQSLRDAHAAGRLDAHILDLAMYEVGNVLVRALSWPAAAVAEQLADLMTIVGTPLVMDPTWFADAAELAVTHRLTFYDAAWAAAARGLGIALVSADRQLLAAGVAESATTVAERLGLVFDD